jgi:hypothetical protein
MKLFLILIALFLSGCDHQTWIGETYVTTCINGQVYGRWTNDFYWKPHTQTCIPLKEKTNEY